MGDPFNLRRGPAFDEATAGGYGKKRWWWVLDMDASKLVTIGWQPATGPLVVELPAGRYKLGAGPPDAYREEVIIGADGREVVTHDVDEQTAPCITPGCGGVIHYHATCPLPSCAPFDLSPPADRLCNACRKARPIRARPYTDRPRTS